VVTDIKIFDEVNAFPGVNLAILKN